MIIIINFIFCIIIDSDFQPVNKSVVFPSMESSLTVNISIHDDNLSEDNEQFLVQVCYTSNPLKDVCMEANVIIKDNDG